METITIRYEDYEKFLEGYTKSKSMELDLQYIINSSSYDRYDKDINFRSDDLRVMCKKYMKNDYESKLKELSEKEDN